MRTLLKRSENCDSLTGGGRGNLSFSPLFPTFRKEKWIPAQFPGETLGAIVRPWMLLNIQRAKPYIKNARPLKPFKKKASTWRNRRVPLNSETKIHGARHTELNRATRPPKGKYFSLTRDKVTLFLSSHFQPVLKAQFLRYPRVLPLPPPTRWRNLLAGKSTCARGNVI